MSLAQIHQDLEAHLDAADLNGFKLAFENVGELDLQHQRMTSLCLAMKIIFHSLSGT